MVLLIPTGDGDEENATVNPYWGRCGRVWRCMSTRDGVVDYPNVDLYWGRCGRERGKYLYWGRTGGVWCCRSLLGTMLKRMTLHISTGDGVVGYGAVYLYWGRCGGIPDCRYQLGTVQ